MISLLLFILVITSYYPLQSSEDGIAWKYTSGGKIIGSAVADEERINFGSDDGIIHALDPETGKKVWTLQIDGRIASTPAIANGSLYILSGAGSFYAIETETGRILWTFSTGGEHRFKRSRGTNSEFTDLWDHYLSDATVSGSMVYFGSSDSHIYALETGSGKLVWKFKTGDVVHATPAIHDGVVYAGGFDGYFYALDALDGSLRWKFNTIGSRFFPEGSVQKGPAADGTTIFFGSRDGNLYALDAQGGTGHWNYKDAGGSWIIATPSIYNGRVYFGTSDSSTFYCLHTVNGRVDWKISLNMRVYGSAVGHGQLVFFGAMNGFLYGVDGETGNIVWRFQTDGSKKNYYKIYNQDDSFRDDFTLYGSSLQEVSENEERIQSLGSILATPLIRNGKIYVGSTDSTFYAVRLPVR